MYRRRYCTTPGVGVGVDKMLKFFKVLGKALTGELSCKWIGVVYVISA